MQWETWIAERIANNKFTLLGYHGYILRCALSLSKTCSCLSTTALARRFYLSGLSDGTVCANQGIPREAEQVRSVSACSHLHSGLSLNNSFVLMLQWEMVPIRKGVYALKVHPIMEL